MYNEGSWAVADKGWLRPVVTDIHNNRLIFVNLNGAKTGTWVAQSVAYVGTARNTTAPAGLPGWMRPKMVGVEVAKSRLVAAGCRVPFTHQDGQRGDQGGGRVGAASEGRSSDCNHVF